MTTGRGQVRLRDLPRLSGIGKLNAVAAAVTLSAAGGLLGLGEWSVASVSLLGVTLTLGMANLYLLDKQLREVST